MVRPGSGSAVVVELHPRSDLFEDDNLRSLEQRAMTYLRAGIPVHLRGPAGTGKSTMALQVATRLGRPVALMSGDHGVSSSDLIGKEGGVRTRRVVDRFIHNVQKQETETSAIWLDSTLTTAILNGYTLFYDEFTRSPPEANNALLMALEERRLIIPARSGDEQYIEAHPEFRAIFTSNPDDYAGVKTPQDALIDRMITLEMGEQDRLTEAGIVSVRTGLDLQTASPIVDIVRAIREDTGHQCASVRSAIMIGTVVSAEGLEPSADDPAFVQLCVDALYARWASTQQSADRRAFVSKLVEAVRRSSE